MRPAAALLVVLAASAARADELAKLFTDQGKIYLRSEAAASLVPGAELPAFSDAAGTKAAGKAIVMEVTGQLARVTFEDDASRAAAKYVRVGKGGAVQPAPGMPPPPPPPGLPPPPPPLKATLGRGNGTITVRNDSDGPFTECELKFPDRRFAPAGSVKPRTTISVGYDAIRPAPDIGEDLVLVRCAEGEAELHFDEPQRPNALHGRATAGRGGGVFIYNDGATDWTQCDLVKPNGNHFFQGTLRAHASDSIRGGLFKPPSGAEIITLTCAQGAVSQPVP